MLNFRGDSTDRYKKNSFITKFNVFRGSTAGFTRVYGFSFRNASLRLESFKKAEIQYHARIRKKC